MRNERRQRTTTRRRSSRKLLLVPVGAVAVALSVGSVAYACTYFQGTFTVSHVGDSHWVKAWGCDDGTGGAIGLNHMTSDGGDPGSGMSAVARAQLMTTLPATLPDEVDLATGSTGSSPPGGTPCWDATYTTQQAIPTNQTLPAGTYDVGMLDAGYEGYQDQYGANAAHTPGFPPCVNARRLPDGVNDAPPYHKLGTVTVSSGSITGSNLPDGTATATVGRFRLPYSLSDGAGGEEAAICIQDRASTSPNPTTDHGNQVAVDIL